MTWPFHDGRKELSCRLKKVTYFEEFSQQFVYQENYILFQSVFKSYSEADVSVGFRSLGWCPPGWAPVGLARQLF